MSCLDSSHDASLNLESGDFTLEEQAFGVISTNCASCHFPSSPGYGSIAYMDDLDTMVSSGVIIPGNPGASSLYAEIETGQMPPAGSMSLADVQVVRDWIISLGQGNQGGGNAGSLPNSTFTEVFSTIIQPRCTSCHDSSHDIPLENYDDIVLTVTPGNYNASLLWDSLNTGRMPKTGGLLTSQQVDSIAGWIQQGALNN